VLKLKDCVPLIPVRKLWCPVRLEHQMGWNTITSQKGPKSHHLVSFAQKITYLDHSKSKFLSKLLLICKWNSVWPFTESQLLIYRSITLSKYKGYTWSCTSRLFSNYWVDPAQNKGLSKSPGWSHWTDWPYWNNDTCSHTVWDTGQSACLCTTVIVSWPLQADWPCWLTDSSHTLWDSVCNYHDGGVKSASLSSLIAGLNKFHINCCVNVQPQSKN
jgi:hypothetical protein